MPVKKPPARRVQRPPTPDDRMTKEEKEDFEQQVEEFEGPDRREVRGKQKKTPHEPGVSRS
jgi:hypothetical protein